MIALVILLVFAAGDVGVWWLYCTPQGWFRRHEHHGQIMVRRRDGDRYVCPCGAERARG